MRLHFKKNNLFLTIYFLNIILNFYIPIFLLNNTNSEFKNKKNELLIFIKL